MSALHLHSYFFYRSGILLAQTPEEVFGKFNAAISNINNVSYSIAAGQHGINYRVMYGNIDSSSNYFLKDVPTYVLVDRDGHIRYAKAGSRSELHALIHKVDQLIDVHGSDKIGLLSNLQPLKQPDSCNDEATLSV
ncbi:MAG: hypothetical protein ABIS36_09660 [Chryseolinea sp.]